MIVDQGVSSLSNFLLLALVGRWLGPKPLGSLALAIAVWAIAYGIYRAAVEDPMVVFGDAEGLGEYIGATAICATLASASIVGASVLAHPASGLGEALVALAAVVPALFLQDFWRRVAYMRGQPHKAVINDVVYLIVQVTAIFLIRSTGAFSAPASELAWGAGAVAGSALGFMQFRPLAGALTGGLRMLQRARRIGAWLVLDFAVNRWARQVTLIIIALTAGEVTLGAIQASISVLGFTNVLVLGWSSAALADGAQISRSARPAAALPAIRGHAIGLASALAGCCILYAVAARWVLVTVYGGSFGTYADVAPIVSAATLVAALDLYPSTVARVQQATRRLFVCRAALSPTALLLAWPVSALGRAGSAAAFLLVSAALTAGAWMAVMRVHRPSSRRRKLRGAGRTP